MENAAGDLQSATMHTGPVPSEASRSQSMMKRSRRMWMRERKEQVN